MPDLNASLQEYSIIRRAPVNTLRGCHGGRGGFYEVGYGEVRKSILSKGDNARLRWTCNMSGLATETMSRSCPSGEIRESQQNMKTLYSEEL